jgi:glycosyltransferase involved in cell wall biosynthesis
LADHRPTVLQIIPTLDTGGAELSTVEIAAALVTAGARALVATEGGRLATAITAAGGEIVPFPAATKNPLGLYTNTGRLARLIETERVDLVHARSRAPAWSARWAARRTKRPFVTTYHGAYNETGPLKRAYNRVMASGDVVIANSAYTAGLVMGRYATPEAAIEIIHRGVDETVFDPANLDAARIAALRAAWLLPEGATVILHAARLTRWKGQLVLIEALGKLAAAGRLGSTIAILAGDDQGRSAYTAELRAAVSANGLDDAVRLVGHVSDMPAAFAIANVTVIASIEPEAFGRTSIEAQRMGCPVIATRIGAPPETVLAPPEIAPCDRTGWLVPPGDADALAGALQEALSMPPGERTALGARASQHAGTHFTLHAMRRATLAVYDRLLGTDLAAKLIASRLDANRLDADPLAAARGSIAST